MSLLFDLTSSHDHLDALTDGAKLGIEVVSHLRWLPSRHKDRRTKEGV
jgi:hypothetical protein